MPLTIPTTVKGGLSTYFSSTSILLYTDFWRNFGIGESYDCSGIPIKLYGGNRAYHGTAQQSALEEQ